MTPPHGDLIRHIILVLTLLSALAATAAALTAADLHPAMTLVEKQFYDGIKSDTAAAQNFLITRDYVRKAEKVRAGTLPVPSFPLHKPAGFRVKYLLPDDPAAINIAIGMRLSDPNSSGSKPAPSDPVLTPADLDPAMTKDERAFFDGIKKDRTAAQNFLVTRDYVRKAQKVVAGTLPPLSFPSRKPYGFRVAYLLPGDPKTINDALGACLNVKLGRAVAHSARR